MNSYDIVLTGIPRSGTTLACHLLNELPDVVALHEPMQVRHFAGFDNHTAMCDEIQRFFTQTRRSLREHRTAVTKHIGGKVPDNHVAPRYTMGKLRTSVADKGDIVFEKPLSENFLLCIKHPAVFTALLESLSTHFPCFAIVRNPLAVLASWNTVQFPVRKGRAPAAERLDKGLVQTLTQCTDRIDRQIHLLSWFYHKYRTILPIERILRYEDIIASGGATLSSIVPEATSLRTKLENKNRNPLYRQKSLGILRERLLQSEGGMWEFYTQGDVEVLCAP